MPLPAGRGMTRSDFWLAVEDVFGSAYGRSLCQDLFLPTLGASAEQALAGGDTPQQVWQELLRETGKDSADNLIWHRGRRGQRS